jgi:hypothetical protein
MPGTQKYCFEKDVKAVVKYNFRRRVNQMNAVSVPPSTPLKLFIPIYTSLKDRLLISPPAKEVPTS